MGIELPGSASQRLNARLGVEPYGLPYSDTNLKAIRLLL
jgi:hypothetical protein